MKRLAVALAWLALAAPAVAVAQQQNVNPRDASGILRGEPNDPAGTLTVRVVQGRFTSDQFGNSTTKYPPGQVVHLVAVGSDGNVSKISQPVGDEGRAVFKGLVTDGSAIYYATTVLPRGEVEDVLVGKTPITPPPQVGMRVMLAGPDPESTEPAVDDGADPRLAALDPGNVLVDVRGLFTAADRVTLREVGTQWSATVGTSLIDNGAVARFVGVPSGNEHVYVAEVIAEGRVYRSEPLQLGRSRGGHTSVFVYPNLLVQFHAGAEVDDQKLWVQIQVTMANLTGTPFDPGPGGLEIPLPYGTVNASVDDEDPRVRVDKDRGAFIWKGAFPAGQEQFTGQFALPVERGEAELVMPMPYGAIDSQMSMRVRAGVPEAIRRCVDDGKPKAECEQRQVAGLVDTAVMFDGKVDEASNQRLQFRFRTLDGGVTFLVMPAINVRAGGELRITFKGLPSRPAWLGPAEWVVGLSALGFIALAIAGAFWLRGRDGHGDAEARRAELTLERDRLFEKLVQVETRRRDADVNGRGEQASDERAELKAKLVAIDEELRELR